MTVSGLNGLASCWYDGLFSGRVGVVYLLNGAIQWGDRTPSTLGS